MGLDPLALHTIRVSGMEHEKASQRIEELLKDNPITSSNSNGSSNPAVSENFFNEEEDDDAALEAIAAQSEASMSMMRNESINRPLHVQVNGFSTSQGSNSKPQSSSSSFAGSSGTTTPSTSYGQSRPSSLIRTPVMGPPVNSSTRSLLSPAGMIPGGHNDYSAQPSSFYGQSQVYRSRVQSMYQASSSNLRSPSGHNSPSTSYKSSTPMATYRYPPSTPSMAPPPRKDLEVSKRRICTDYVQIMREEEILKSLLPGMGDVTNNQIGMIMRRFYKSGLMCEDLPGQVRQTVFDDTSDRKIRAVASRQQQHPMDKSDTIEYKTDSSDDEEALMEPSSSRGALKKRMSDAGAVTSEEPAPKKINQATSRWLEEKCKFGRMANKCDFLIEEKFKERRRLVYELLYRTRTGRTWMEGEEPQRPREIRKRRNQDELLPVVHLHTGSFEGCARERPVAGFARRKFYKDPIKKGDGHDEVRQMLREPLKANELMKFRGEITFYDTANGTKETIPELIEVEDNVKGLNINTAAHVVYDLDDDTAQGVLTKENNFFTEQLLNYYHRLSTVPAMTLRTSPNRSTITATGEDEKMRSGLIKPQKTHTSKKISRRAERKSVVYDEVDGEELEEEVEEQEDAFASSDDDEWMVDHKPRPKKKAPKKVSNRPAKYNKKSTTNTAKPRVSTRNSTWRLDDFYMEDLGSMPPLPTKLTYARITVPTWEKVTVDWAADLPTTSGNDGVREEPRNPSVDIPSTSSADIPSTSSASAPSHHVDELTLTVARAHHALTFLEREKVKRSQENKQQKSEKSKIAALSKAAGASAASKPGQVSATSSHEDDVGILIDEKQLLEEMPPFRPQSMLEEKPKVMSRYASIAKPYTLREFDAPAKNFNSSPTSMNTRIV